jgi:micrococcal nuclease
MGKEQTSIVFYYRAKVNRVIDGDTLELSIDLGFSLAFSVKARLQAVNAPEISRPKDEDELKRGLNSKARVESWLAENSKDGFVVIKSHDGKQLKQEKFGRWLVEVFPANFQENSKSLNKLLLEEGHAIQFMGKLD